MTTIYRDNYIYDRDNYGWNETTLYDRDYYI